MTTTILPRLPVTKAVRQLLIDATKKPIGLGAIPQVDGPNKAADNTDMVPARPPYAILYPLWRTLSGDMQAPDRESGFVYQVTCVAARTDQLDWMTDQVVKALLARNPDGSFQFPLEIPDMSVMDRSLTQDAGMPKPDEGTGLQQSDLRFLIRVTPTD